jgi:hypothetical protein
MRKEFLSNTSRYSAAKACPWAAIICKVDNGYLAFESIEDYRQHKKQR